MTKFPVLITLVSIATIFTMSSQAQAENEKKPSSAGVNISTLGLGIQANQMVTDKIAIRGGWNHFDYKKSFSSSGVDYDGKLKLDNYTLVADFYPNTKGSFHYSAGLLFNNNKVNADGKPQAGATFTINGTSYTVSQVQSVNGDASFNSVCPYIGIGWGKPAAKGNVQFTFEVGAVFEGKPSVNLTANTTLIGPALTTFQNNLDAQKAKLQDDLNKLQVYPVVTAGVVWSFD